MLHISGGGKGNMPIIAIKKLIKIEYILANVSKYDKQKIRTDKMKAGFLSQTFTKTVTEN